jgi:hypothetical protein
MSVWQSVAVARPSTYKQSRRVASAVPPAEPRDKSPWTACGRWWLMGGLRCANAALRKRNMVSGARARPLATPIARLPLRMARRSSCILLHPGAKSAPPLHAHTLSTRCTRASLRRGCSPQGICYPTTIAPPDTSTSALGGCTVERAEYAHRFCLGGRSALLSGTESLAGRPDQHHQNIKLRAHRVVMMFVTEEHGNPGHGARAWEEELPC